MKNILAMLSTMLLSAIVFAQQSPANHLSQQITSLDLHINNLNLNSYKSSTSAKYYPCSDTTRLLPQPSDAQLYDMYNHHTPEKYKINMMEYHTLLKMQNLPEEIFARKIREAVISNLYFR